MDHLAVKRSDNEAWDLVSDWKVETGDDPFDEPSAWVWIITIADSGEPRWLYVHFHTRQDQEELDELERQEELEEAREISA